MTVKELIETLSKIESEGKGSFTVVIRIDYMEDHADHVDIGNDKVVLM